MTYLLCLLLLIVAIMTTYFVTKKKAWNKGYKHGELSEREKHNFSDDLNVKWNDNIILYGINPLKGINVYEKEHDTKNGLDKIPYFGIRIKYIENDEKPNERFYSILAQCGIDTKTINISPKGISDEYHTFDELYYYRLCYNAALINSLVSLKTDSPTKFKDIKVCKSKKHFGGEPCYGGGWFIVMISTPWGQISNHYKLECWDMFNCPVVKESWKWDGHGMKEAMERLNKLSKYIATNKLY